MHIVSVLFDLCSRSQDKRKQINAHSRVECESYEHLLFLFVEPSGNCGDLSKSTSTLAQVCFLVDNFCFEVKDKCGKSFV